MYKILIVDDETMARRDILFKISRSGFNFKWIMEAADGTEALDIIQKNKPDIMITDIMMNEMSGIDLIRASIKIHPDMVSIIICGYADFTFAQEAIDLNVIQYLLKPVKPDQLTQALSKAILKMDSAKSQQCVCIKNDVLEQQLCDKELQENLNMLLNCNLKLDQFKISTIFPSETNYYLIGIYRISINTEECMQEDKEFGHSDYNLLQYGIKNIMMELGGDYLIPFHNPDEPKQIIAITASSNKIKSEAYEELKRLHNQIFSAINQHLKVSVNAGLSSINHTLSASMMMEAKSTVDLRLYFPNNIFCYSDYSDHTPKTMPETDLKLYQNFLDCGDVPNALNVVDRILNSPDYDLSLYIRVIYIELICILVRSCCKKEVNIFSLLGSECINGTIFDRFENKTELFENLKQNIMTAINLWVSCNADTDTILQNVKSYIENNFTKADLSTKKLSQQFCISLGYLSASFSRIFGTTISKYILSLRMQYTCKLLKESKMSVSSISENVGYNNMSYFMRTFKKNFGCTPTEYREHS